MINKKELLKGITSKVERNEILLRAMDSELYDDEGFVNKEAFNEYHMDYFKASLENNQPYRGYVLLYNRLLNDKREACVENFLEIEEKIYFYTLASSEHKLYARLVKEVANGSGLNMKAFYKIDDRLQVLDLTRGCKSKMFKLNYFALFRENCPELTSEEYKAATKIYSIRKNEYKLNRATK